METWTEVTSDGITLCLPPGWRVRGSAAHSGTAEIRWGRGDITRQVVRTEIRTVAASDVGRITQEGESSHREYPETIGGRQAIVSRNRVDRRFYTTAQWTAPRMWVAGEASSEDVVEVQMAIIRSVRFPAS